MRCSLKKQKYLNDLIANEELGRDPTVAINSTIQSLNTLQTGAAAAGAGTLASRLKSELNVSDIIITGQTPSRLSQKQVGAR